MKIPLKRRQQLTDTGEELLISISGLQLAIIQNLYPTPLNYSHELRG